MRFSSPYNPYDRTGDNHTFLSYANSLKLTHNVKSGSDSELVRHVVVVDSTSTVDIEPIAVAIVGVDAPERAQPQVATSVLYDSYPLSLLL